MKRASVLPLVLLSAVAVGCASSTPKPATAPSSAAQGSLIEAKTAGLEKKDGFIPIYLDNKTGKIFLEIPRDSMRALMFYGLATGLGSNPIGLDRGAGGDNFITRFDRNGDRMLVVFENWNYRRSVSAKHFGIVADCGAVGRKDTRRRDRFLHARLERRLGDAQSEQRRQLLGRARPVEHLPAIHARVS
jgi:hypothetical protein